MRSRHRHRSARETRRSRRRERSARRRPRGCGQCTQRAPTRSPEPIASSEHRTTIYAVVRVVRSRARAARRVARVVRLLLERDAEPRTRACSRPPGGGRTGPEPQRPTRRGLLRRSFGDRRRARARSPRRRARRVRRRAGHRLRQDLHVVGVRGRLRSRAPLLQRLHDWLPSRHEPAADVGHRRRQGARVQRQSVRDAMPTVRDAPAPPISVHRPFLRSAHGRRGREHALRDRAVVPVEVSFRAHRPRTVDGRERGP